MAHGEYNVVFRGALTGEKPEDEVKTELAALFKASAAKIEALFSGRPVVLKRNVDSSTAIKFRAAFQKAGAVCELVPADDDNAAPQGGPAAAERPAAPSSTAEPEPRREPGPASGEPSAPGAGAATTGQSDTDSLAAAGDPNGTVVNLAVPGDLSHLSIDDSDRPHQPHEDVQPPPVDISSMSLAEDDTPLSPPTRQPEREFDTSGMSLEPPPEPPRREVDQGNAE